MRNEIKEKIENLDPAMYELLRRVLESTEDEPLIITFGSRVV